MARIGSNGRIGSAAAVAVIATLLGGLLVPSPAVAVPSETPSATVAGVGTSGTISIPRPAGVPASVVPTTTGLNAPRQLGSPDSRNQGHTDITFEDDFGPRGNWDVVIGDRRGVTMLRVDSISYGSDLELDLLLELYDSANGGVAGSWTSAADGPFDRIDIFRSFGELDITPIQREPAAPGFFDLRATVVRPGGLPLTLTPSGDSSVTASWSGLAPATDYLATVSWGADVPLTVVEVASSGPREATTPIAVQNATIEGAAVVGATLQATAAMWDTPGVTTSYRWMLRTESYEDPDTVLSTEPQLTLVPADRFALVYLVQEATVRGRQTGFSVTQAVFVLSESWTTATPRKTIARPRQPVVVDAHVVLPAGAVPIGRLRVEVDGRAVQTVPLEASARGRLALTIPRPARGVHRVVVRYLPPEPSRENGFVVGSNSSARRLIVI